MKIKRFVKNLYLAIEKVEDHLWFMAFICFFMGLHPALIFGMGFALAFSLCLAITLTLIRALVLCETDELEELNIEGKFVDACEPGLTALPEERRDEFRQRLLNTCDYYPEELSFKEWIQRQLGRAKRPAARNK